MLILTQQPGQGMMNFFGQPPMHPPPTLFPQMYPSSPARLPNGDKVRSMHTFTLDLPDLPAGARAAHITPGLASHSLLSVVTMCNAGCTTTFTKINCTIMYRGRTIICGHKCTRTGLWMVSLKGPVAQATYSPHKSDHTHPPAKPTVAIAAKNVDTTSSTAEYARYIHQCICSPP